jgi:hypothetical protein
MLPPYISGSLDLVTKIMNFAAALVGFLAILKKLPGVRKLAFKKI